MEKSSPQGVLAGQEGFPSLGFEVEKVASGGGVLQEDGRDSGPCRTEESEHESCGQQRVGKAVEFTERRHKALKSERGPSWGATEDFCP